MIIIITEGNEKQKFFIYEQTSRKPSYMNKLQGNHHKAWIQNVRSKDLRSKPLSNQGIIVIQSIVHELGISCLN